MDLGVVGGLQPLADRRQLRTAAPARRPTSLTGIVHAPHIAQGADHRHAAGLGRCIRRVQGLKQAEAVGTDRESECFPLRPTLGQPVILDPASVTLEPDRLRDPAQPIRRGRGQIVERGAQRLGDEFEQM